MLFLSVIIQLAARQNSKCLSAGPAATLSKCCLQLFHCSWTTGQPGLEASRDTGKKGPDTVG